MINSDRFLLFSFFNSKTHKNNQTKSKNLTITAIITTIVMISIDFKPKIKIFLFNC
jgi:hypothetical protein